MPWRCSLRPSTPPAGLQLEVMASSDRNGCAHAPHVLGLLSLACVLCRAMVGRGREDGSVEGRLRAQRTACLQILRCQNERLRWC